MNLLLTNDDGYQSEALEIIERVFTSYGHYVMVIAPTVQQSGMSHAVRTDRDLELTEYRHDHYHLSGTPADCVLVAHCSEYLSRKPDAVISGINKGVNMSTDILYSGTCGAARQASIFGYKAIALSESHRKGEEYYFERDAQFIASRLDYLVSLIEKETYLNINFPHDFNGELAACSLGYTDYHDQVWLQKEEGNTRTVQVYGLGSTHKEKESAFMPDYQALREHKASMTLIKTYFDIDSKAMARWQ